MANITLAEPNVLTLPTQDNLPCDDGIPMETQRHKWQMDLLIETLLPWLDQREDGYVGGNMFVYYSLAQLKNQDFKGPDFFAVLGVPKKERKSWVVWEEEKAPDVIIELLSDSTATIDKTEKKLIYQDKMRVSEYFWFDPFNTEDLAGFYLQNGVYQPITPNAQNQWISQTLNLALVLWEGSYRGLSLTWLRWATLAGELLPTAEEIAFKEQSIAQQEREIAQQEREIAQQEREIAQQEREIAQQAQKRAENAESQLLTVARNLLEQKMTVQQVSQLTGLPETEIESLIL